MARVGIAAAGRQDIKSITRYLANKSGMASALDFSHSVDALRERLRQFPKAYAIRPRLGATVRVAVVSPYLVLYQDRRDEDRVIILRVLHGRRNITADLIKV